MFVQFYENTTSQQQQYDGGILLNRLTQQQGWWSTARVSTRQKQLDTAAGVVRGGGVGNNEQWTWNYICESVLSQAELVIPNKDGQIAKRLNLDH